MPAIRLTPVVRVLLILSVAVFLLQMTADQFFGTHLFQIFALTPEMVLKHGYVWQLLSYAFVHVDLFHILFNLLILAMVGSDLESQWGSRFFIQYTATCGFAAAAAYLLLSLLLKQNAAVPLVGSTSMVYGLLVAFGIIYSERIMLFMMIFPMKAKYFVLILAGIEFVSTIFYRGSGYANAAHLAGMLAGFGYLFLKAYVRIIKKRREDSSSPKKRSVKKRRSHLRLVVNNEVLNEFEHDQDDDGGPDDSTYH